MKLDKQDLLEWLEEEIREVYKNGDLSCAATMRVVSDTIKSGRFDAPSDDRLRAALETTTEPTGSSISKTQIENIKKLLNDPAYHGMYRSGIFDVLEELGITIPGINAPEKEDNA